LLLLVSRDRSKAFASLSETVGGIRTGPQGERRELFDPGKPPSFSVMDVPNLSQGEFVTNLKIANGNLELFLTRRFKTTAPDFNNIELKRI
jgi:hypothetical protein